MAYCSPFVTGEDVDGGAVLFVDSGTFAEGAGSESDPLDSVYSGRGGLNASFTEVHGTVQVLVRHGGSGIDGTDPTSIAGAVHSFADHTSVLDGTGILDEGDFVGVLLGLPRHGDVGFLVPGTLEGEALGGVGVVVNGLGAVQHFTGIIATFNGNPDSAVVGESLVFASSVGVQRSGSQLFCVNYDDNGCDGLDDDYDGCGGEYGCDGLDDDLNLNLGLFRLDDGLDYGQELLDDGRNRYDEGGRVVALGVARSLLDLAAVHDEVKVE